MAISKKDFEKMIKKEADIEKVTSISSDGKTLITRIPKKIVDKFNIKKGNKFKWLVDNPNRIKLRVEKNGKKNT